MAGRRRAAPPGGQRQAAGHRVHYAVVGTSFWQPACHQKRRAADGAPMLLLHTSALLGRQQFQHVEQPLVFLRKHLSLTPR